MSPILILSCIAAYFGLLLLIAWYTSRKADNEAYFLGNKASPWYAVAFGLIGDSLSGVTFISVPGAVGTAQFSYMQLVFGYFVGYFVISYVLLPLYYRLNLTSIYSYLDQRFGAASQKTGSFFFLVSRIGGAAGRLFLAAGVLQIFVFDHFNIPFGYSVLIIIALMLVYTYRGGIKTLVWTDTFQSTFLLLGVILSIFAIAGELDLGFTGIVNAVEESKYSQVFFWDWKEKGYFWKQFIGGAFIAIAMTGLDQNMMQKNLSCRSLKDAQKNINSFSFVVVIVNLFFLALGALLYIYSSSKGVAGDILAGDTPSDKLFPVLALEHLGLFAGLAFIVGLTAATFSSADSVLTTLTTSFYIDFLRMDKSEATEKRKTYIRHVTHVGFAILLLLVIIMFDLLNAGNAVINTIIMLAGYTYGPLLGLFAFGLFTKLKVRDSLVPLVCLLSPVLTYYISDNSASWFGGYKFGPELLLLNGLLTFMGMLVIGRYGKKEEQAVLAERTGQPAAADALEA